MDEVIGKVSGALGWFINLDSHNKLILIGGFLALMFLLNWQWKRGRREKDVDLPVPSRPYPLPSRPTFRPAPRRLTVKELSTFDDVAYRPRPLLTRDEVNFWGLLFEAAPGYHIFPKMVLNTLVGLDSLDPDHYRAVSERLKALVIDFVICDSRLAVTALIDLEPPSENKNTEREELLDFISTRVGYKVVRFGGLSRPDAASIKEEIFGPD